LYIPAQWRTPSMNHRQPRITAEPVKPIEKCEQSNEQGLTIWHENYPFGKNIILFSNCIDSIYLFVCILIKHFRTIHENILNIMYRIAFLIAIITIFILEINIFLLFLIFPSLFQIMDSTCTQNSLYRFPSRRRRKSWRKSGMMGTTPVNTPCMRRSWMFQSLFGHGGKIGVWLARSCGNLTT